MAAKERNPHAEKVEHESHPTKALRETKRSRPRLPRGAAALLGRMLVAPLRLELSPGKSMALCSGPISIGNF